MVTPVHNILGKNDCPHCGSVNTFIQGRDKFHGDVKVKCLSCKKNFSYNEND